MAYEKKSIKVVAGGLNLLAPGDLIDDSEAQELVNFSTDSAGSLRSRRGHALRYSVGGRVVAMTRALGSLWAAAGGAVYQDGAAIIGGVSSNRVGLAGFKGFLWAMSAADQRKSDGAQDFKWLEPPPAGKPTIKAASLVETPVDDFSGGWTVDPAGDDSYAGGLQIAAQAETAYSLDKGAGLDLGAGQSLDDMFKVVVWCKQWAKVDGITFQMDCNLGDFTTDVYTAFMKGSDIQGGHKEEVTFYLRKRPLGVDQAAKDKNRHGHFERIGSTPDKDYRSIVKLRIKVDFNDTTKLRFKSWSLIGDNDNTFEGDDFVVYYTYTTDAGHESNPSDPSDPITLNRTGIDVSNMVASGDAQVTGQNVYVTGGTLGHVYRVNGITPVVGTTYQIRKSEDQITADNIQLENDHDQPPVVGGLIGPFYGRLIAFGGSKFYWSHRNKPYAFFGPQLTASGDWDAVEEGIGDLIAATMRPGILFLYGTNGVAVVQGDPGGDSAVHRSAVQMGIRSSAGVVQSPRGDFAAMSRGAYLFNGDAAQLLSKKIDSAFKDGFDFDNAAVGYQDDVYWISDGSRTFRWDALTDRWFEDSRLFSFFYSDEGTLIGATTGGDVLELESGHADNGAAFNVAFKSKAYDAGILDNEKTWEDATIWADTGGAALSVVAILNSGQADEFSVALGSIQSGSKERFVLEFNPSISAIPTTNAQAIKARNCAIRITGLVSSECVIHEMALNYYVEAREAKTFDSDEKDFGSHKAKEIRQVYVDLHSPSAAQFILQTDQPGFEMAARDSGHSFAASITRRGDLYVFSQDYIAHNARFLLRGDDFRLYGMRALLRMIGTLLHGSKGEFYDSDAIDLGEERVKLYKEIEVEYASTAAASLEIFTDLPGPGQAQVALSPFALPQTGGLTTADIRTFKVRLRGNAKGRIIRARTIPEGDFRLEALRFFFKLVGAPNATGWNWAGFPVEKTGEAQWSDVFLEPDKVG